MVVTSGVARKTQLHSSGTPDKNCWNSILFLLSSSDVSTFEAYAIEMQRKRWTHLALKRPSRLASYI